MTLPIDVDVGVDDMGDNGQMSTGKTDLPSTGTGMTRIVSHNALSTCGLDNGAPEFQARTV